ncbi:MAG: Hsp20/alpha crystallin family protein [Spirochaetaceae bacterium]|nr:Hsp20/alpha crystallin family protein [Spirochaetaceae bacterium]
MRSLVTYRPHRPTLANFDRWFDSVFQNWGLPAGTGLAGHAVTAPRVDVQTKADAYHLEAELPGLTEKDFTVNVEHNLLTIASRQETNEEREEGGYVIRERRSGAFRRSFTLPEDVDADAISATFKDGLLTLTVPKTAKAQARQIAVKSAA